MSMRVLTVSGEKSQREEDQRCEQQLHLLRSTCDDYQALL